MTLRILLTNTHRSWNGETASIELIARGLEARGCSVHLASKRSSELNKRLEGSRVQIVELELSRHPLKFCSDLHKMRGLIKRIDPDIVHCHSSRDSWVCAANARLSTQRALRVRTKHNLKRIRSGRLNRFLYQHALHAIIAPSPMVLDHLCDSPVTRSVPKKLVHYGINLERFKDSASARSQARQELLREFPSAIDPLIAVYFSRLSSRKQPERAVEAILEIAAQGTGRPIVLALAGNLDGPTARRCIQLAADHPHISFLGFQNDAPRILAGADVFLLPSLNEAFGLAAIEAMACGTVPILPRSGSFPRMLDGSQGGVLYDSEDQVKGISAALERLSRNANELTARSDAARERASQFDAERMVDGTLSYYQELLAGRAHEHPR